MCDVYFASARGSKVQITYIGKELVHLAKQEEHSRSYARQVEKLAKESDISNGEAHKQIIEAAMREAEHSEEMLTMYNEQMFKGKDLDEAYQYYISFPENRLGDCFNPFDDLVGEVGI